MTDNPPTMASDASRGSVSDAARARCRDLCVAAGHEVPVAETFARFIQQVSDAAKEVYGHFSIPGQHDVRVGPLAPFILPEPVDPLLIEAREIFAKRHDAGLHDLWVRDALCKHGAASDEIRRGTFDKHGTLLIILAALRRGMELARETANGE